jgi:ArsR family transcriptional regulator
MLIENFAKVLSDQTRLRILMLLTAKGDLCVCELTQALGLAQPKISRHLAILRESGLLQDRKSGLWVHYCLHPDLPNWAVDTLARLQSGSAEESLYQSDRQRLASSERQDDTCHP